MKLDNVHYIKEAACLKMMKSDLNIKGKMLMLLIKFPII